VGQLTITVTPADAVAAVNGAAEAGQEMEAVAGRAATAGEGLGGALAAAPIAAEAFAAFWSRYEELPLRSATTLLHQATCVGRTLAEIVDMDESMAASVTGADAQGALEGLHREGGR